MGIKNIVTSIAGEIGFNPNLARLECDDNIETIISPGYLSNAISQGYTFRNGDFVLINSSIEDASGLFQLLINSNQIVLIPAPINNITDNSVKKSCLCATTTALDAAYYNGPNDDGIGATLTYNTDGIKTIDTIVLQINSVDGILRVLVKDGAAARHGIYDLTRDGATGVFCQLTRSSDFNQSGNIHQGDFTLIDGGSVNKGTIWYVDLTGPFEIGFTPIPFTQAGTNVNLENSSEYIPSTDPITLTTEIPSNITSIVLSSGTWMVFGSVGYENTGSTMSEVKAAINTTAETFPDIGLMVFNSGVFSNHASSVPMQIIESPTTTTVYLVAQATFAAGTTVGFGGLNVVKI